MRRLGLKPHPEGGYYAETFRSPLRLTLPDGRVRSASTAIHYLLPAGAWSTWHRVRADEVWHHYEGAVLCGCTVAPGFEFEDFELGVVEALAREFPAEAALIRRLER